MPNKKKAPTRARGRRPRTMVPTVDLQHPENYITSNMKNISFGNTSGAIGTGSLAFNDQLMNTSSTTGNPIQPGTGVNQRLGKHIYFTRFVCRLRVLSANPFRVIIGRNQQDGACANLSTNATLTAYVEGAQVLEGCQNNINGSGSGGSIDTWISPSTDFQILHDRVYNRGPESLVLEADVTGDRVSTLVEIDIPLNLQRMYTYTPAADSGGWFFYMCASDPSVTANVSGILKLQYINQFNFEAVGKGVRDFVTEAGRTISHVAGSDLYRYASLLAPVFGL